MNTYPVKPYPERESVIARYTGIVFDGAPKRFSDGTVLHPDKFGFETQGYVLTIPAAVERISQLPEIRTRASWNGYAMPTAYHIDPAKYSSPLILLASKNGTSVMTMRPGGDHVVRLNADGDEVWYVHTGRGTLWTSLGRLSYTERHLIYIPRGVSYCFSPNRRKDATTLVGIQSPMPLLRPNHGQFVNGDIPYAESCLRVPEAGMFTDGGNRRWNVSIQRGGQTIVAEYPRSPFLRVAWRGTRYPFVLDTADINTLVSPDVHIDPSAFAVFAAEDASVVVSVFRPRWLHSLPYYHMNRFDEFLFYASGYEARGGWVGEGDATFHPQGFWHGPQPDAFRSWMPPEHPKDAPWGDELAIMFETRDPLFVNDTEEAAAMEKRGYWRSWCT